MKLIKYKLGDLIRQRRQKNDSNDLPICGVTRDGFIPPKQQDADTSLYNVFYLKDFVFNPARMELNAIVFNDRYEKAICSSLYEVFYVHRPEVILPEYLALLVKQDWFTRYCKFMGSGSAREYCRVANISELEIEVPPIEFQAEMARDNQIIRDRIELKRRINDNLAAQGQLNIFAGIVEFTDFLKIGCNNLNQAIRHFAELRHNVLLRENNPNTIQNACVY